MRTFLLALLLPACSGLTSTADKTDETGRDLDTADTAGETGDTSVPDTSSGQNRAPVADAGDDVTASVGVIVELDGAASSDPDGDALDYTWTMVEQPTESAANLINAAFVDPQFIPDAEGRYVIELVVSDGELSSAPATVEITATQENGRPVANAGADQTVGVGATVQLDGTRSTDPDGDGLAFAWTLTSRPGGSTAALTSGNTANPSFVADVAGSYQVSLTVADGENYSDPDIVVVTASSGSSGGDSGCGCHAGSGDAGLVTVLGAALVGLLRARRR